MEIQDLKTLPSGYRRHGSRHGDVKTVRGLRISGTSYVIVETDTPSSCDVTDRSRVTSLSPVMSEIPVTILPDQDDGDPGISKVNSLSKDS